MEQLQSIATRISRGSREAHRVTAAALGQWAASRQVSLRQAMEAALAAGIFPAGWRFCRWRDCRRRFCFYK